MISTNLRREGIQPLEYILADAMQASAACADQAFWLNEFLKARKMGGQIGGARFRRGLP